MFSFQCEGGYYDRIADFDPCFLQIFCTVKTSWLDGMQVVQWYGCRDSPCMPKWISWKLHSKLTEDISDLTIGSGRQVSCEGGDYDRIADFDLKPMTAVSDSVGLHGGSVGHQQGD